MNSSIIFQIQSFIILLLIYYGVYHRKNRKLHVRTMLSAIIWDFILIIQIELTRSAIKTATGVIDAPLSLQIHLFFALGSALLFLAMIFTGRKILQGDLNIKPIHKKLGWTTVFFRTTTLLTSYFIVTP